MFKEKIITLTYLEGKQIHSYLEDMDVFDNLEDTDTDDNAMTMLKFGKILEDMKAE